MTVMLCGQCLHERLVMTEIPDVDRAPEQPERSPYPAAVVAGAVYAATRAPVTSLIASTVLLDSEQDAGRRAQLSTWKRFAVAWFVGGLLASVVLLIIVIAAISGATSGRSGACRGGVDITSLPSWTSNDGIHWVEHQGCIDGGSTARPVPAGDVPGGGK